MTAFPPKKVAVSDWTFSNPTFDKCFIFGTLIIALGSGVMASVSPAALIAIVLVDIWIFANPHVIATYTRIGSCSADIKRHWFLIFFLPAIVLVGVTATALAYEVAGLFTLYFIAQNYHVSRQSFGIARGYKRTDSRPFRPDRLSEGLIYIFPFWGLLHRCAQSADIFLGYAIKLPIVSPNVVDLVGVAAIVGGLWWVQRQCRAALAGQADWRHDWFVASHVGISLVAYTWITDITVGWLVVNVWHNIQYLLFVQVQNLRRDRGVQGESTLNICSTPIKYFGLCLLAGSALYGALDFVGKQLIWLGLPTVLLAHFTVNFHHYLVDGVIWKRRGLQRAK